MKLLKDFEQRILALPVHQRRFLAQVRFHVSPSHLIKLLRSSRTKHLANDGGLDVGQGIYV